MTPANVEILQVSEIGSESDGSEGLANPAPAPEQYDLAPEGHAGGPWLPQTIRDVEWALERIGDAGADVAEIQAQLDAAVQVLTARARVIIDKAQRRATWLSSLVECWARDHRAEVVRGKVKTRELLGGSVGFRAQKERVVVQDQAAVIAWAEAEHLELLRVTTAIDKKALDAYVAKTGEVPPGVDVEPATEHVVIKTAPLPRIAAEAPRLAGKE